MWQNTYLSLSFKTYLSYHAIYFPKVSLTRPSALGMSDPVMESLEILGTPEFSNLWRVEGYEGENDEKVVKKDEKQWKIMKKW